MEDKTIELTITKEDGYLYECIKNYKNIDNVKMYLRDAVELYEFCNCYNTGGGPQEGYLTPELYRDIVLKGKTNEELIKIKNEFEKEILLYASNFHPDECDCGIIRGPDTVYWFIDESSTLGFITLYSNYIKMIDELLKEQNSND